ncbi:MAG: saccharopine dehydrogenase C-terminal domain-containing protein, partial [Bacteroidota bacterium]
NYLLKHAASDNYLLTVADLSQELAVQKTGNHPHSVAMALDINNDEYRRKIIEASDIVISLLPPALHIVAAGDCVSLKKPMVTASYISPAIEALNESAVNNGVLLLNECGLDPGIDHMSAMEIFHRLLENGAELTSFKSYTGGLIAPEYVDNLWGYKFTWNPKNVILAGQGTAKYIENGRYHYIPYNRLFRQLETIEIENAGKFEGYANRDSLAYRKHYKIDHIPTLLRGTLRHEGFCKAWDAFVQLGLTDDNCIIENSETLSYKELVQSFLPSDTKSNSVEQSMSDFLHCEIDSKEMLMLKSTGIFDDKKTGLKNATAAMILQHLLEQKWVLKKDDKDMIVMVHLVDYLQSGKAHRLTSSLVVKGNDQVQTAMAKTVGYPLGIVARLLLKGKISLTGVHLPTHKDIYIPVLRELDSMGITFSEKTI